MDCSLPGSSIHGILQARILEWVTISFSRGSSRPRDRIGSPALEADVLTSEPAGKLEEGANARGKIINYKRWQQLFDFKIAKSIVEFIAIDPA